jgi:glycosyltransferase involved in cell wall biosynthesis
MPTVSVVIPVFNGERYLREAMQSVFAQTYQDYEVVCIDDGSTDASSAVLRHYGDRIILKRQANAGQGSARNEGVRNAAGGYVAFLDQDDRWYPHKLDAQMDAALAHPDAVLVYCNSDRMDRDGHVLRSGVTLEERPRAATSPLGRLLGCELILPSSMLVRRDVFLKVGGFDPELRGFEDFDLCARLHRHGRFVFLDQPGMCYRVHDGGFSQAEGGGVIRSRERFLVKMQALYAGDRGKQALIHRMLGECYSDWGQHELRQGNVIEARTLLRRSLRHDAVKFRTYSRLLRAYLRA